MTKDEKILLDLVVDAADLIEYGPNGEEWHKRYNEYMGVDTCEICNKPQDEDGRCGCTNRDANI